MRVITLDNHRFDAACRQLEDLCRDYAPDLVVAIATGGVYVADRIFGDVAHLTILKQRSVTAHKTGFVARLLRHLPRPVADVLRMAESRVLSLRRPTPGAPVLLDVAAHDAIKQSGRVLVVDDAVDSGATLLAVLRGVANVEGEREVRSAVVTVTTSHPLVQPDYSLYNNHTLIRFPWSKDNQTAN